MAQLSFKKRTLVCTLVLALVCSGIQAQSIVSDSWIQIASPLNPPTVRHSHSAVFDVVNKSMVVFGGTDSSIVYNDISAYVVDTGTWYTNVKAAGAAPLPRFGHTAVATGLNTMVIFGGTNGTMVYNDVAVFDLVTDSWLSVATSGDAPAPRAYHSAAVDRYQHAMYVYGGSDGVETYADVHVLNLDTWAWAQVAANGSARQYHSALMTPLGVMVVFGGMGRSDAACFWTRNLTWYACATDASPSPSVRYGHTAVLSPLQQMTVFGGRNSAGNPVNDVWDLDLSTFKWTGIVPGGVPIDARTGHSAIATPFGSMILFGGLNADNAPTNDFGVYNLASTVLRSANDGAIMVVLVTLLGTILISMCFAMDYMQEQSEIDKEEAIAKAKTEQLLLPKLPPIPKALQIPLGPRAQKFFDEFKMSLDPMADPPK